MKVKPMGTLWMMPAGWLNHRPGAPEWALEALPGGRLMGRMNKFTLLDDAVRGFGDAAAGGWVGDTGRRRLVVGFDREDGYEDYPRSFALPVLTSARTAALICSGILGQAATISARSGMSGFGSVTPRA